MEKPFKLFCKPIEKCTVKTPYGTVHGKKCTLGREVNRLVVPRELPKIIREGKSRPHRHKYVSMSACPTQTYGGTVRLIFDTQKLQKQLTEPLRPMCYVDQYSTENKKKVLSAISHEAAKYMKELDMNASNYVRAKYALSDDVFASECEFESKEAIPVNSETVRAIEFWIANEPSVYQLQAGRINNVAGVPGIWEKSDPAPFLEAINAARQEAKKLGVPFRVKSCYKYLMGEASIWGSRLIPLTKENLVFLSKGKLPPESTWIKNDDRERGALC